MILMLSPLLPIKELSDSIVVSHQISVVLQPQKYNFRSQIYLDEHGMSAKSIFFCTWYIFTKERNNTNLIMKAARTEDEHFHKLPEYRQVDDYPKIVRM